MSPWVAHFEPGPHSAAATPHAWVLAAGELDPEVMEYLLSTEGGGQVTDVGHLTQIKDAVVLVIDAGEAHLLVRGQGRVTKPDGSHVTADPGGEWRTETLTEVDALVLSIGTPTEQSPRYRAVSGVFPAADLVVRRVLGTPTGVIAEGVDGRPGPNVIDGALLEATAAPGTANSDDRPLVLARECSSGHLNAPYAYDCRICGGTPLLDEVREVPRPSLGRLKFSSGHVVEVDRPILIGRAPGAQARSPQAPLLVSVPGADVSRNHVEVRPEDWTALVVDLNSSNGTSVALPGRPQQRLRPQEPLQIIDGTEVFLTDAVTFRFEVSE